jgi:hypothetical protein
MSLGTIWPCFCPTRPCFLRVIPHWGHQKPLFLSATPHFSEFAKVQIQRGRANNGLHSTRLSPLKIGGHTRFLGVLWRRLFPAAAARVKPTVGRLKFQAANL